MSKNKVVGWFHGQMEFGPKALANGSIIANPRLRSMKDTINKITSIVHEDNTCRIQTVNSDNGMHYNLIKKFYELTRIPCILNSSFNLSFEPIIEDPKQAEHDFKNSSMDMLVIENFVVEK